MVGTSIHSAETGDLNFLKNCGHIFDFSKRSANVVCKVFGTLLLDYRRKRVARCSSGVQNGVVLCASLYSVVIYHDKSFPSLLRH